MRIHFNGISNLRFEWDSEYASVHLTHTEHISNDTNERGKVLNMYLYWMV